MRSNFLHYAMIGLRYAMMGAGVMLLTAASTPAQNANRDVVMAPTDVGSIVDRVAKRSGDFKEEFDKAVEHSMLDDTKMEGRVKREADRFHDNAKKLKDVFEDKKDKDAPAVRHQVDKTLGDASALDQILSRHRFTDKVQRDWQMLRGDMNALAAVYGLSPI